MFFKIFLKNFYIIAVMFASCSGYAKEAQEIVNIGSSVKKTAVVSLNNVLEVLPSYRTWKKDTEKRREQAATILAQRKDMLTKDWQKLEGLRAMLGEQKYNAQKKPLEERMAKLEQEHAEIQQKLYFSEQSVAKRLDQEMQKILEELCASRNINIVLNGAIVLYVNRSELNLSVVDLTPELARLMESRVPSLQEYLPNLGKIEQK